MVQFFVILIGRFCGTVGLIYLLVLFTHKKKVTFRELIFIYYAGLIRGAIAFALVFNIDSANVDEKDVIITTVLTLVVITTVFFGSLMPLV
jgi:sodium/hydrogen exchanger-like protein 6/7/sodium/hydrogen exchanger 8